MLLGNGVLYEWCNVPSLKKLSRLRGSSGYNYFMSRWLGFFWVFLNKKKTEYLPLYKKMCLTRQRLCFPNSWYHRLHMELSVPKLCAKKPYFSWQFLWWCAVKVVFLSFSTFCGSLNSLAKAQNDEMRWKSQGSALRSANERRSVGASMFLFCKT